MKKLNLKIDPDLKEHVVSSATLGKSEFDWVVAMIKGSVNDDSNKAPSWSLTMIPADYVVSMSLGESAFFEVEDLQILVVPPELAPELEGKYMDWEKGLIVQA